MKRYKIEITKLMILVGFSFFMISCAPSGPSMKDSFSLSLGMTKNQVMETIGKPKRSEFDRNVEEWFYCLTGLGFHDEHLAIYFLDGKLIKTHNYVVTSSDPGVIPGLCEINIKKGNYRVPDEITEIRLNVDSEIKVK